MTIHFAGNWLSSKDRRKRGMLFLRMIIIILVVASERANNSPAPLCTVLCTSTSTTVLLFVRGKEFPSCLVSPPPISHSLSLSLSSLVTCPRFFFDLPKKRRRRRNALGAKFSEQSSHSLSLVLRYTNLHEKI